MLAIGAAFVALRPALPNLMAPVVHYLYQAEWSRYVLMSNRDNLPLDYYLGLSSTLVPYISAVATIVALALIFAVRQVTIRLLGLFALAFVVVFATFSPQFVLQGVQTQIAGLLILFVSNGLLFGVWIEFLAVRWGMSQ